MKHSGRIRRFLAIFAFSTILLGGLALATDFSSMSTDELVRLRGTMCTKSQEERDAFRQEWQKRMAQMTPEERSKYAGPHHRMGNCMSNGCMNSQKRCRCQGSCMNGGNNS